MKNKLIVAIIIIFGSLLCFQLAAGVEGKSSDFRNFTFCREAVAAEVNLGEEAKITFSLPEVEILPTSKVYFLKIWWEKVKTFFKFSKEKKVDSLLSRADNRLSEADKLITDGKYEEAVAAINESQVQAGKALDIFGKFDKDTAAFGVVLSRITERLLGEQNFLEGAILRLPDKYKSGVESFDKLQQFIEQNKSK